MNHLNLSKTPMFEVPNPVWRSTVLREKAEAMLGQLSEYWSLRLVRNEYPWDVPKQLRSSPGFGLLGQNPSISRRNISGV